jgi:putative intracellular protease/amidase
MADNAASNDESEEKDEDGLAIQKYEALVLVVVPPTDFAEQTLRHARSSLANVSIGTRSVSTEREEMIRGRLQDEFLVDDSIAGTSLDEYAGVIFVGGQGALELADNPDAQRLAREAADAGKLIGAWGCSVAILAKAGVLRRRRVTGASQVKDLVRQAGGKFTGCQLERDKNLITALDEAVGIRFGKALAQVVGL